MQNFNEWIRSVKRWFFNNITRKLTRKLTRDKTGTESETESETEIKKKCIVEGCNGSIVYKSEYCRMHKCVYPKCRRIRINDANMCVEHKCRHCENISYPIDANHTEHTCQNPKCIFPIIRIGEKYCERCTQTT